LVEEKVTTMVARVIPSIARIVIIPIKLLNFAMLNIDIIIPTRAILLSMLQANKVVRVPMVTLR
jgi:hypothetical protein